MPTTHACTTERLTAEIDALSYIADYRDAPRFEALCRQCNNYGRRHGCPPFDFDPLDVLSRYERVTIVGLKVIPADKDLPLSAASAMLKPVVGDLNSELLDMERATGGFALGFACGCPYCPGEPCACATGGACRHPSLVRPSLEAFGFDVDATARNLLGIEIRWGRDNRLPEYLTLVGAVFQ